MCKSPTTIGLSCRTIDLKKFISYAANSKIRARFSIHNAAQNTRTRLRFKYATYSVTVVQMTTVRVQAGTQPGLDEPIVPRFDVSPVLLARLCDICCMAVDVLLRIRSATMGGTNASCSCNDSCEVTRPRSMFERAVHHGRSRTMTEKRCVSCCARAYMCALCTRRRRGGVLRASLFAGGRPFDLRKSTGRANSRPCAAPLVEHIQSRTANGVGRLKTAAAQHFSRSRVAPNVPLAQTLTAGTGAPERNIRSKKH